VQILSQGRSNIRVVNKPSGSLRQPDQYSAVCAGGPGYGHAVIRLDTRNPYSYAVS